jgi:hypothetical protein
MAFTVEDGTVVANANAYMTVAQYRAHHQDRGRAAADTDVGQGDVAVQAAIILATDYIDKRFGRRFKGGRVSTSQELEWPRQNVWDEDDNLMPNMPSQLLKACAEYAWLSISLGTDLAPPPDGSTGTVEEKTDKVGPIEETRKYADRPMTTTGNPLTENIPEYPQADLWIEELIVSQFSREFERG